MNVNQMIEDKVQEVYLLARRIFPSYVSSIPQVSFFRAGNTGAIAQGYRAIRFNLNWFEKNAALIDLVVRHEMAHIVCSATGLGRNHDNGWKRVCLMLGGDGKRTISCEVLGFTPEKVRTRLRYEHKATCGTVIMISDVMHNKLRRKGLTRVLSRTGGLVSAATFTGRVAQ